MTAIAGVVDSGKVYIGGDSAAASGYHMQIHADAKVFRNGPCLFGFTTSFRMGQLLHYAFVPPEHDAKLSDYAYLVTTFIDAVRDCLKAGGYNKTKEGEEQGGTFLLGYRGHLYKVWDDYQIAQSPDGFDACGCGQPIVLGALYATKDAPPEGRIRTALEAAARYSTDVRGPFVVEVLA